MEILYIDLKEQKFKMCSRKTNYKKPESANVQIAKELKKNPSRFLNIKTINIYECPFCKNWHKGSYKEV